MNDLTRHDVARELLRRQRARESLIEYSQAINIPGVPIVDRDAPIAEDIAAAVEYKGVTIPGAGRLLDPTEKTPWKYKPIESRLAIHHVVMMQFIQRVMLKRRGRGIIMAPPGSAKSTYGSVVGPSWYMGKFPGSQIILGSYGSTIAAKQSRKVRSIVRDPQYTSIWQERPTLAEDQRAVDDWSMTNNSAMMAAGLLAGITGNRADGVVIDDPVRNREEADSPTIREKTYNEYIDTVMTRAKPHMWLLLIQTRWHEEDLAGCILPSDYEGQSGVVKGQDGNEWEVLNLPAKCEHEDDPLGRAIGDYLWPEWFPREHWSTWEFNPRAKRTWAALYQQRPTAASGIIFQREQIEQARFDPDLAPGTPGARPAILTHFGASDYATMEPTPGKKDPDFSEHGVAGVDNKGGIWVLDWWYGQKETDKVIEAWIKKLKLWSPVRWGHEGGIIDKAIGPYQRKAMRAAGKYTVNVAMPQIGDKALKLEAAHGMVGEGMIHLPLKRAWAERVIEQLVKFPGGRWDDAADVIGILGRLSEQVPHARAPVDEWQPELVPFTAEWLEWQERAPNKVRYTSGG